METIEIENTYNQDGVWIKSTANGVPLFIPEQTNPSIQILDMDIRDCEWFMTRKTMPKEEFERLYGSIISDNEKK